MVEPVALDDERRKTRDVDLQSVAWPKPELLLGLAVDISEGVTA